MRTAAISLLGLGILLIVVSYFLPTTPAISAEVTPDAAKLAEARLTREKASNPGSGVTPQQLEEAKKILTEAAESTTQTSSGKPLLPSLVWWTGLVASLVGVVLFIVHQQQEG